MKALAKRAFKRSEKQPQLPENILAKPKIIPRDKHPISRKDISEHALKVLYRLHNSGYQAFLVGGCVRDLILCLHLKDFDIAINVTSEEVRKLFINCRFICSILCLVHDV